MIKRVVCWFSCGAASAVATKLALTYAHDRQLPAVIAYVAIAEEHPDNQRFMSECQAWFGQEITVLHNEKYHDSIYEVFRKERYLVGPAGAPCTKRLKRAARESFEQDGDLQVFGFTAEEQDRADRLIDANSHVKLLAPLIEKNLSKADCLGILDRVGIQIPYMYRIGYQNNNCVGCVKGGRKYWSKIRTDFPDTFERMATTEQSIGATIFRNKDGSRMPLRSLPVYVEQDDAPVECGIFCLLAITDMKP